MQFEMICWRVGIKDFFFFPLRKSSINYFFFFTCFITSICNLYNWRYKTLGNLAHIEARPEYRAANAGFCFDFQLINVEDLNGVGESEPSPYFFQVSCLRLGFHLTSQKVNSSHKNKKRRNSLLFLPKFMIIL